MNTQEVKDINQVFIQCHDNDFWNYYLHALKQVYDYVDFFSTHGKPYDTDKLTTFIKNTLDNLYLLNNDEKEKFPWEVKVFYNEDAKRVYSEIAKYGNSECAYMDIESYLITPNATIKQFIHNV